MGFLYDRVGEQYWLLKLYNERCLVDLYDASYASKKATFGFQKIPKIKIHSAEECSQRMFDLEGMSVTNHLKNISDMPTDAYYSVSRKGKSSHIAVINI